MVSRFEENGKTLYIISNSLSIPEQVQRAFMLTMQEDNQVEMFLVLIYFVDEGMLVHVKPFEKKVVYEEAVRLVKKDILAPDTVFDEADLVIKLTGKHPRSHFKKLLGI